MRWNENVTVDFVKVYLKNECLWKPNHPDYKCRVRRIQAYEDIAADFKASTNILLTIPEIKMKIKNLRSTYMQEVHKILQKSTPKYIYVPSLVWFEEMDKCLKNIISVNRVTSNQTMLANNIMPEETSEVDSSCNIWGDQADDSFYEENPDPLVPQPDEGFQPKLEESSPEKSPVPHKKLKKKKHKFRQLPPEKKYESFTNEDEFDIFGKYIASQLRTMHLQKALRLKLEIHSIVNDARISDMSD
ncbi:uncharacterized protein LOC126965476 [Leptidea sinapis]|uniref:MADF domain-containing protein n=1 Tax=Leptidea sinapis TaxID=189913 RepID=A0A5E4R011_9NEOP|nr:uncharacterized protein LOC126965476 [Leptidea sinapis]VVD03662.1 unnamed protein product [Leptidea sinapis]